jgi:branched-subunit amino acid transport protein
MQTHSYFLALLIAALLTLFLRSIFLASQKPLKTPKLLNTAMDFMPGCVLSALVFQEFFYAEKLFPSLSSGIVALILALLFGKDLLTIGIGLVVYWTIDYMGYLPF